MMISFYLILIITVTSMLMTLGVLMSMKTSSTKEKSSPYECGFDNISSSRSTFSIQFFIITIIFIIFDVELSIILPFSIILNWVIMWKFILISSLVMLLLTLGLIYEWKLGALNWMN